MKLKRLTLTLAFGLAVGCSSSEFDLAPVSGIVTLDGEPLADGGVSFQPLAQAGSTSGGPGSTSRTDAEGRFSLSTIDGQPGAVIGSHQVKVFSYSPEMPIASDTDSGPSKERVPARYNYRTQLTFDVPAGGTEQANFELTTDAE